MGRPRKSSAISEGMVFRNKSNEEFEIVRYSSSTDIVVRFVGFDHEIKTSRSLVMSGSIKNKMRKNIFGVGFIGIGENLSQFKGRQTKQYTAWYNIMRRCYDKSNRSYSSYGGNGVTVCDEWHDFQAFADWYNKNHPNDGGVYDIDKDELSIGSKTYSPSTCQFISKKRNSELANCKIWTLLSPDGSVIEVRNMAEFCRERNLSHGAMSELFSGKRKSNKGYRLVK